MGSGGLDVESMKHNCGSAVGVEEVLVDVVAEGVGGLGIEGGGTSLDGSSKVINSNNGDGGGVQVMFFTEIYAWIGCNSARFGRLHAAAPTRPNNTVSVTDILGGSSDNTGSDIAHRLVLKTGLNVMLACNIPKNSPMLVAEVEKKLLEKLINLGYTRPKSNGSSS
ncbi:hypothetical protein TEA_001828 [Camellia sinensis var. sinensis]|uniref:Proteasome assembly chaperone 3 n=1 Tax=Camellia sinensis var. sinensis TaxID=542762 RepID=A0A4S4ET09_CAMSN|nr:hypothetical protein TEA_001828 [Camellia sinensis var. sinensis]